MDLFVSGASPRMSDLVEKLRAGGVATTVIMVDNQLHAPDAPVPDGWRDVRLRTPAGMLSLKRREGGVAVVVFGNADPQLSEMQRRIGELLKETT
jgi:hypothetical protein